MDDIIAQGLNKFRRGAKAVTKLTFAHLISAVVIVTMTAPSYAASGITSAIGAPAGDAGLIEASEESSGIDAALLATPEKRGASPFGSFVAGRSAGGGDEQSASFVPPDTPYNGAFTRSLSIDLLPFFEITPNISLNYNSGASRLKANDGFSPLGVGWSLSGGSSINRTSKSGGVPSFSAEDVFNLDGNGLVACTSVGSAPSCAAGGAHVGRFETYERISKVDAGGLNYWTVTARNGTVSTYRPVSYWNSSSTQDARLKDAYRWLVSEVRDTDGNAVSYTYDCSALPNCYVTQINYGTSIVSFHWESRGDALTYATGISISPPVDKRLKTIAVYSGGNLVRAYSLGYSLSPDTKRSLLSSFQQFGSDATIASGAVTAGTSLPADTFAYTTMADRRMGATISDVVTANANPEVAPSTSATEPQSKLVTNPAANANYVFGDFNGDNKTDLLVTKQGAGACQATFYASGQWVGTSNTPTGGAAVSDAGSLAPIGFCTDASNWYVGDFNGDGRDDLATSTTLSSVSAAARSPWIPLGYAGADAAVAVVLLNGGSVLGGMLVPAGGAGSGSNAGLTGDGQPRKLVVGDFNGDGKDDFYRGNVFLSTGTAFDPQNWANSHWGRAGDFNGDGKTDLFVLRGVNGNTSSLLISTGAGWDQRSLGLSFTERGDLRWPEFEGSYAVDVVREPAFGSFYSQSTPSSYFKVTKRYEHSDTYGVAWPGATPGYSTKVTGQIALDMGGYRYYAGTLRDQSTGSSNDSGHSSHYYYYDVYRTKSYTTSDSVRLGSWGFSDLNGDGATDALQIVEASGVRSLVKYLSTGTGFVRATEVANLSGSSLGNEFTFTLADLNGDGIVEVIRPNAAATAYTVNAISSGYPSVYSRSGVTSLLGAVGDYNGDGKVDLTQAFVAAPSGCSGCVAGATDSTPADLLKHQDLASGGAIDVEYLPSTYWSNGYLPAVLQVMSKVTTSDGRGNSSSTKYAYQNGAYDVFEHKFLGFETVTAELPCETGETSCPWVVAKYRQEAVAAGALKQLEVFNGAGTRLRLVENGYVVNQSAAPFTANQTSEQVTDYLVGGSITTRKEWSYDGFANLLEEKDLGVVGSALDDVTTQTSYQLNLADYLVSSPTEVVAKDSAGTILRRNQLYYDGASDTATAPTRGHVTTARAWLDPGSRWVESTSTYDATGNITAVVDPLGNSTEMDYDVSHQYVVQVRNPLWFYGDTRQKTSTTWNALCGQPATSTDLNDQVTSFTYDALCRPTRTDYPTTDYETVAYLNIGNAATQYVERARKPADGTNPIWSRSYFDGIGRTYKTSSVSADPTKPIIMEAQFAKRGQANKSTAPYYQGDAAQWTSTSFDLLGRPTLVTLPDTKTIAMAYEAPFVAPGALTVKVTDPLGRISRTVSDVGGHAIQKIRYLGSTPATTAYSYDVLGQLIGVSDPTGNIWSNVYDTLGRRTSSADPDLGTWSYTYDDAGQLATQTDAKGQQTVLVYDRMGRVLSKVAGFGLPGADTTTNIYDEARSGYFNVGELTTAANANASIAYNYDLGGHLALQTTSVDGQDLSTTSTFDAGGRLVSRTYPDGSSSGAFGYNTAGQPITLSGAITGTTYTAAGQVKTVGYANGVTTTYGYSTTRGWLDSVSTVNGATSIESLIYTHDFAGRITAVAGGRADESWTYGYNDLDQLLSAANTNTPALSQTFSYDVSGNLTLNSAVGTYAYPAQGVGAYQPHAVMSAGSWTFTYDLNGNQTTRTTSGAVDRAVTYDAENRAVAVAANGNAVTYLYGPDGARLKKIVGSSATLYLGDDIERDPPGAFTVYITSDVKRIAGASHYLHRDHLASIRAVTDASGAIYRASTYRPYGEETETVLSPLTPDEPKGFIGERTDKEIGLTYLHARYYDAALGRFLQPDWWETQVAGGSTNRYSYSANDPINKSDRNGLYYVEEEVIRGNSHMVTVNGKPSSTSNPTTIKLAGAQAAERQHQYFVDNYGAMDAGLYSSVAAHSGYGRDLGAEYSKKYPYQKPLADEMISWFHPNEGVFGFGEGGGMGWTAGFGGGIGSLEGLVILGGSSGKVVTATETVVARSVRLGVEGEAAAGIAGVKVAVEINGRVRVPDGLTDFLLTEVKNVARQSWTRQLRDYSDLAGQRGIPFELWVRENTQLSGPLRAAELRGDVIIHRVLPRL